MKITPRHNKFIEAIADSPIHIIATMRGKDQYEVEKGDNGKVNVKKLGVGAKQRDGFEYEFTATFLIDQKTHMAEPQKDNTHVFENDISMLLTEDHGRKIIEWANSGEGYTPPVRDSSSNDNDSFELDSVKESIGSLIEALKNAGVDRKNIIEKIGENNITNGKKNPDYTKITDLDIAKNVLTALESLM